MTAPFINIEKDKQRKLASFALFSRMYITRTTLEDETSATSFYRNWINDNKLDLNISEQDIPEIINLAKKGEKWLEEFLAKQEI